MTQLAATMTTESPAMGLWDRFTVLLSWVLAAAAFLTVGWRILGPEDPLGPVSVLACPGGPLMLIPTAGLAGLIAAVATLLAGRRLVDVGTFTAALGLLILSLRGATAEYFLLIYRTGAENSSNAALPWRLAGESLGWFAVLVFPVAFSTLADWLSHRPRGSAPHVASPAHAAPALLAGYDVPRLANRWFGIPAERQTGVMMALWHTALATGIAMAVLTVLSAGVSVRSIRNGQVCFVVAASVGLGSYVAHRFFPVRSALWSMLSAALLAILGYMWAGLRLQSVAAAPNVPVTHFLRVLPVQFIAVGVAAAIATFWHVRARTVQGTGTSPTNS